MLTPSAARRCAGTNHSSPWRLCGASLIIAVSLLAASLGQASSGAPASVAGAIVVMVSAMLAAVFVLDSSWRPDRVLLGSMGIVAVALLVPLTWAPLAELDIHLVTVAAAASMVLIAHSTTPRPRARFAVPMAALILGASVVVARRF